MTTEDKELLIKDICARLPYGIKVGTIDNDGSLENVWDILWYNTFTEDVKLTHSIEDANKIVDISEIKPYLFPLASMTEEHWNNAPSVNLTNFTFESLKCGCFTIASYTCENDLHDLITFVNWLIKNHFDVNNLIPMKLAIDATNLNIY